MLEKLGAYGGHRILPSLVVIREKNPQTDGHDLIEFALFEQKEGPKENTAYAVLRDLTSGDTYPINLDGRTHCLQKALTSLDRGELESSALSVLYCYESKRAARQNQELSSVRENPQCVSARE